MRDYRQGLADRLGVERERLHFEVRPGAPPSFDVLVDGKDLTPEQEQAVVSFLEENPDAAKPVPKPAKAPSRPPPQPKVRCQFCEKTSVDSARVGESLRYVPYCAGHREEATADADRILKIVTRPCTGCGAPAPFYHHKPDCKRLQRR